MKIGFLHEFLVRVNDFVKKVKPVLTTTNDFLHNSDLVLSKAQDLLLLALPIATFFPVVAVVIGEAELILTRIRGFIESLAVTVNEFVIFIDEFDLSSILADAASNTQFVKGK